MVLMLVRCLYCHSHQVTKRGKTKTGKQRYRCHNPDCEHQSFLLNPAYKGRLLEIKQHIIDISLNASGVREGIHLNRDNRWSIAYSEELIFSMSATLQSTDRHHGIVGQEHWHFQRDS
jgi:transposase-like protein